MARRSGSSLNRAVWARPASRAASELSGSPRRRPPDAQGPTWQVYPSIAGHAAIVDVGGRTQKPRCRTPLRCFAQVFERLIKEGLMWVEGDVGSLERELAQLARELTAPQPGQCVLCFVQRMLTQFDCDTTLRWAKRWRDLRAPQATALEHRLGARGGSCDCEIFWNGWEPVIDPATGTMAWPDADYGCRGVPHWSSQPCSIWTPRRRGWR